ncbi:glycoside hydrolase family 76 protein [Thermothelomyces thermophilus ATCC 42464]|uniref:mannan endo-1,6-alpha-mannosidase n=1 Tax=Thermothelomyces thermophilus (strain ATCC 42464 / BCRC 31852 / DSM 1799) TaxID=573729 RepID=G2Q0P2_THET4|nr:glycoside hydrolase family 76 protein [Thermothelomyces thermophilus ATCC 42464]AEO54904.1 glycoside hydrolase family 76 protein [Thermothelomyces thermophilus ATCC 42464]
MHCLRGLLTKGLLATAPLSEAYTLDLGSKESLTTIARSMVEDMMSFYPGNRPGGVPGLLPKPYYWWEGGTLMGSLIDYWYYTGDTRWNGVAQDGLLFQTGPNNDYMPPNQTMTEGNDDQGFWGMAVMSAAELNFDDPPHGRPQWLALAQAVFNTQAARWEERDCGGGLRWQIFPWNNGYDYKNSISQACFFNIAARLALYTGNQSYADWADRVWDWMATTKLLNPETYHIYDGVHVENCSRITPYQWTYNAGAMLLGAAALYNHSASAARRETWRERVDGLLNGSLIFFTGENGDIMTEVACEPVDLCDLDQQSFKAYLSRWMAATIKWAPWTNRRVKPLLASSAAAAVATCTGGDNGRMCGLKWNTRRWDGTTGVGQQMAAMEVVLANAIEHSRPPVTDRNGGTSVGDPGAGSADVGRKTPEEYSSVSTAEKTGAYILTVLFVIGVIAGSLFALDDEYNRSSVPERLARLRAVVVSGVRSWSCSVLSLFWQRGGRGQAKGKWVGRSESNEQQ